MPARKVIDRDYDVVNTTFSEIMVILVFITLVFIGVGQVNSARLSNNLDTVRADLQASQEKVDQLEKAIAALYISQPDLDAPLISRLINFNSVLTDKGVPILSLESAELADLAEMIALLRSEEISGPELDFIISQIRERGFSDFENLIAQLDLLRKQVGTLQGRILASGNGIGVCWSDTGTSASEFLFDVLSFNESFFLDFYID